MNKILLGLSVAAASATAFAFQLGSFGALDEEAPDANVKFALTGPGITIDPRLEGLRSGPGGVPESSEIAKIAANDPAFALGMQLFDKAFHEADGLGAPEMNADSCRGCHQDPFIGGAGGLELNVSRFGDDGGNGGPFFNLPGGQGLSKFHPPSVPGREEYDPNTATVFEQRQTPSVFGAGLVDKIPESVILANEDPTDANGDGIFGVANMVSVGAGTEVGRFGWKAQVPRIKDFVKDAMGGELGITVEDEGRGFGMFSDSDAIADPELSEVEVGRITHFLVNLPPPRRKISDQLQAVTSGRALFSSIGCAICHIPELDGANGPVPLYSNLLLHDVMPANFRGMSEPGAGVGMFKTPPLWGVSETAPYMHDGRASTILDAILAHDSEAAGVRANFQALTQEEQDSLVLFLEHL